MAFTDRIVQYPGRVELTPVSGQTNVYDMVAQEGTVTTEGTLLNAANLNQQTQLDSAVLEEFQSAGMAGQYQNDMSNALDFLLGIANTRVFVVETGTDNGFTYRKWSDGRLDAERIWNVGQMTLSTTEGTGSAMVSGTLTVNQPSMMTSGTIEVNYLGNSSNSPSYLERISLTQFRIAKNIGSSVTLQNVTFLERVIGGRWR